MSNTAANTSTCFDSSVPVLIAKAGHYPVHHGTAGIIRSLGRKKIPVYAIIEDRFAPVALSRYLTGAFVWRTAGLCNGELLGGLARVAANIGRRAILIPTDDLAAAFTAEHAQALQKWFDFPRTLPDLPAQLANKRHLYTLCKAHSVPCPEAAFPASVDDVREFIERAAFPVVVKSAESQRTPPGLRSTSIAGSPEELISLYERASAGGQVVLQEYIPESRAEDWIFHGYADSSSDCLVSFTGRKLRSYPPFAGPTALGVSLKNDPLQRQSEAFIKSIGYAGIMDLDYRLDKRDGQYKLLDFNPRIGANFRMFESQDGIDVVRAMHLDLTGRTVPRGAPMENRVFIVEPYDIWSSAGYMRHGALSFRAWWKSFAGRKELAWFSIRDPLPFPTMCVRLLFRAVRSLAKKFLQVCFPGEASKPEHPLPQEARTLGADCKSSAAVAGSGKDREL